MKRQITTHIKSNTFLVVIIAIFFGLLPWVGVYAAPPRQEAQDLAIINQPTNNSVVRGVVPIIGTATHPTFSFYVLEFSPDPGDQWQFIGDSQTPVTNGQLAAWDTTIVPDGAYVIRLRVVRVDGNYTEGFSRQVTVSNSQPLPTDTPEVTPTDEGPGAVDSGPPTATPTPLPPTPTILVEQPVVDTPTPRPSENTAPLQDPDEPSSFIPTVSGFSLLSFRDACLYGGGLMLGIFLLFGFLAALRTFIQGFIDRFKQRRNA